MAKNRTHRIILLLAVAGSTMMASCYSSQQFVQPSLTQKVGNTPEYINNLALNGPEKNLQLSSKIPEPRKSSNSVSTLNSIQAKYATLLSVVPEAISNFTLYHFIDEWYGVRYRLGGTSKAGIDCSAFVQKVYENVFGLNLVRTAMAQFGMTKVIHDKNLCHEGDLVFFNIHGSGISHVGIFLMNNFFVHASSSHGIMISSLDDKYWQRKFACAGRVL